MKKEGFLFFAVFFAGVFLANLLKYKEGNLCRILNIWILEQFAYSSISLERLFWQLFWKRGRKNHIRNRMFSSYEYWK